MASVSVTERQISGGKSKWHVRCRYGRYGPVIFCGSFKTEPDALKRQRLVEGWVAEGKDVKLELARINGSHAVVTGAARPRTLAAWVEEWMTTQRGQPATIANKRLHGAYIAASLLGRMKPLDVEGRDVEAWVTKMLATPSVKRKGKNLSADYVRNMKSTLGEVLKYAGVPAHSLPTHGVKIGRSDAVKPQPPSWLEVLMVRAELPTQADREIMDLMTHGGLRHQEAALLKLALVNHEHNELTVLAHTSKTNKTRILSPAVLEFQPAWLPRAEGRDPEALLHPKTQKGQAARLTQASVRASKKLGYAVHINPHLLRHLHVSVLYEEMRKGHSMREPDMAARLGHRQDRMQEDYAHVRRVKDSYWDYPELH